MVVPLLRERLGRYSKAPITLNVALMSPDSAHDDGIHDKDEATRL